MKNLFLIVILLFRALAGSAQHTDTYPHTVVYHMYVADTTVTFGGKSKRAIAVNEQIPMPTYT